MTSEVMEGSSREAESWFLELRLRTWKRSGVLEPWHQRQEMAKGRQSAAARAAGFGGRMECREKGRRLPREATGKMGTGLS